MGHCIPDFNPVFAAANPSTRSAPILQKQIRRDIRIILSDRRFHYPDHFAWFQNLLKKIVDFWHKLKPTRKFNFDQKWIEYLKKILFYLVILFPIPLVYFLSKIWYREKKLSTSVEHPKNQANLPEDYIRRAEKLLESGEHREAIRYLYLAGLLFLKKEGLIPEGIAFSDSDHLKQLQKKMGFENETYQAFLRLTRLFQEKWYGLKICFDQDYFQASHLLKSILGKSGGTDAKI